MSPSTIRKLGVAVLAAAALLSALAGTGCGARDTGTNRAEPATTEDELRIVSLSPAISRTLVDLNLEEHLVGRSPFCNSVDQAVPVVGDLMTFDAEALVRVRPTHVLIQPAATGVDPTLARLADEHDWTLGSWYLHSVDDIRVMLRDLPTTLGGANPAMRERLEARTSAILSAMDELLDGEADPSVYAGRTLLVFNTDPVSAFGLGSYPSDLLLRLGGENATTLRDYPQLTLEDVTRLDPKAIVLIRDRTGSVTEVSSALGVLAELPITAVEEKRLAVMTHSDALVPSSAVVSVARMLRRVLQRFAAGETNVVEEAGP